MSEVIVRYGSIDGELKAPAANEPRRFTTLRIDQELADWLREKEVIVTGARSESWIGAVASWVLPLLLFYLISSFAFRRLGGGGLAGYLSVGKSRAKLYVETKSKVTFDDVAGVDEAFRLPLRGVMSLWARAA